MAKKINLEYQSSGKSLFLDHLQKLEGSITDSRLIIDGANWEDLSTCIDILKSHTLSDELIIRFTKLGSALQNTGVIISSFYDALLSLNHEQLSKALEEVSTFKYKLSENAIEYLFEKLFTSTAASKFNTEQMTEIIYNLSIPNSPAWSKKATELMKYLSNFKDEDQQNYSVTWQRNVETKIFLEFFKDINIKRYLASLNAYSQVSVIRKMFELKNLKGESDLLSKLSHNISEFLPEMHPFVQEAFVQETFDLRTTETGAKLAKVLLPIIIELLPKIDKSVQKYLHDQNYFIASPKKYDPNCEILSKAFSPRIFSLLAEKAKTDNEFIKQLILTGNTSFKVTAGREIFSSQGTIHINGEIIKALILTGEKDKVLGLFKLSNIRDEKEQKKLVKEIFLLWHSEKKLREDVLDILRYSYVKFLPEVSQEVQKTFMEELFDAKGMGLCHFTAFSKENYELLIELLPGVIEVFSSNKVDISIKKLFIIKIFALKNDGNAHLGLSPLLLTLTDLIGTMDKEMLLTFISKVKNLPGWKKYEIILQKEIYVSIAESLSKIKDKEVQKIFAKQLIHTVLSPETIEITIEKILSCGNQLSKIDFIKSAMHIIILSPNPDEMIKIWVQISKSLQSFTESEQEMFIESSCGLITSLNLQETSLFEPVMPEIQKLINSMNPIKQLELFNKLKSMEISKTIFSQALAFSESKTVKEHLEIKVERWLIDQIKEKISPSDFGIAFGNLEIPFQQKFITKLFAEENVYTLGMEALPYIVWFANSAHSELQMTFLTKSFSSFQTTRNNVNFGSFLEGLLEINSMFFCDILPDNIKYIDKGRLFYSYEAGDLAIVPYNKIACQLGGKDKFFDPSLKLVISKDINPVVKKLFDKTVYSQNIEGRLHDIALTLDSLVKKDTSGLMRTILEAADLPGKFLMQNDLYSKTPDTFNGGTYCLITKDIAIYSVVNLTDQLVVSSIIHELTHKLLIFIFRNNSNPYYYGDRLSLEESSSLAQILKEFEPLLQKHFLFSCYDKSKWSLEVISYLFQNLAEEILSGKASESVLALSEKLNNWVESYLKPTLQDFDSAYDVLGGKLLTEYSSQQVIFKHWSQERINKELEKISNLQKVADQQTTDSLDITGTILGYLAPEEIPLEVVGEN